jgi:hypothetical protein
VREGVRANAKDRPVVPAMMVDCASIAQNLHFQTIVSNYRIKQAF